MISLLLICMSFVFADQCRIGEFDQKVCQALGLEQLNGQCCGESAIWRDDGGVEYTLINTLQFPHDPIQTLALCQANGVTGLSWSQDQHRFLCAGESDGRWWPDQETSPYTDTNPNVIPMSLENMMVYCQDRGVSSVAFITSLGKYACVGDSHGPWLKDVTQYQYGTGPGYQTLSEALTQCQRWGIQGVAYHSFDQGYVCAGASKGPWQPNGTMAYDLSADIVSPEKAQQECQNHGDAYFTFNEHQGHYQCGVQEQEK